MRDFTSVTRSRRVSRKTAEAQPAWEGRTALWSLMHRETLGAESAVADIAARMIDAALHRGGKKSYNSTQH